MPGTTPYAERRNRLKAQLPGGLLLLLGNEESPMNYADNPFPFRQDSTFLYFTGVDRPGFALILDLDEDHATLFGDDRSLDDIVWMGPQPGARDLADAAGIARTAPAAALKEHLCRAQASGRPVHLLPPYRPEHRMAILEALGPGAPQPSVPFIRAVAELRIRKSPAEVEEIERAVEVSVRMHLAAMAMARPGLREAEIMARVTDIALASGGGLSFPVIATVRGGVLHNQHYGNVLEGGQLFLLDAGAETAGHYAGDLSSTFPVDPRFTPRQRDVHDVVLKAFLAAEGALRPGVDFKEVHLLACRTLAAGLKDLGLMKGDVAEAVDQGAHALFFPCGLGHLMGLDVHDMENLGEGWVGHEGRPRSSQFGLKSLRLARELQEGFVLTVEPGIYFMPELTERWRSEGRFKDFIDYGALEAFAGFGGLRIEEDFLVTASGARRLGPPKPRTAAEIEAARS
ncbi:aminopeptidase P family protein [Mesoterricola silvestris]|uniref:Xaa-Pro aminopeptidase n=1 Tax=Mesoterricola silvestris TaxID=2927979 RepID=A0AA48KAG8_9BACT|nr:aminopeptidase P family protein [Mesoterricola silvestris]BDU74090.1 Xaa-Pro aminopeptidase [Mesoterricola silvestris]